MKTIYQKRIILLVFLSFLLINPQIIIAQWSSDPSENTLICNAAKDQREPAILSDESGGVIISWRDYRFTESVFGGEIYAQKTNSSGIVQWVENGIAVNAGALNKGHFRPLLTKDDKGGAIVVWERGPLFFYNYDIFSQRLDSEGEKIWSLNGITITDTTGTKSFHQVISDHAGGAIIAWQYLPGTPGSTDIYAQHIDSTGNVLWGRNGKGICLAEESQSNPILAWDGHGGAIIAWDDSRSGTGSSKVYAQRIDSIGNIRWSENGVGISDNQDVQTVCGIISGKQGEAIVVWSNGGGETTGLFAQLINETGERQWGNNGVNISNATADQYTCDVVPDEKGGAIITWQDQRSTDNDIYAQHINPSGEIQWATNGVPVSVSANNQVEPVAIQDGAGGIIIAWQDFRNGAEGDIYSQRLNASGVPLWQENGIAISTAQGEQASPVLATDGNEGAIFIWADKRNGTDYDIYAQRVDKNGHFGEFQDEDKDGISDQEEKGPEGTDDNYDGNNDNDPDWQQKNVASFFTYDKQYYITLYVPDSLALSNVAAVDNPDPDAPGVPSGASSPYGFFSFSITGLSAGSNTVATLLLKDDPVFSHYYKYGPTPGQNAHWYDFSYDDETGAIISADTIFLYLTDGKRGDYDITENGVIVDPGGPLQIATSIDFRKENTFYLKQNYPNPAINSTSIVFSIPEANYSLLEVYDITGRIISRLVNKKLPAGKHSLIWETRDMPEGIYILRLTAGQRSVTRKIVISR